jgi:WD40 repeat protein
VSACHWSPDNRHIVSASEDKTLRVWDTGPSGSELVPAFVLEGHTDGVGPCAFSPDGSRLVSGSSDRTVRLWDCGSGKAVAAMPGGEFPVSRCGWSPDGRWIASSTIYGGLRIWDGRTGTAVASLMAERAGRVTFLWSPGGGLIFHAGPENALHVWDIAGDGEFAVYYADAEITAFALSQDGRSVIIGDVGGGIMFLRIEAGDRPGQEVA